MVQSTDMLGNTGERISLCHKLDILKCGRGQPIVKRRCNQQLRRVSYRIMLCIDPIFHRPRQLIAQIVGEGTERMLLPFINLDVLPFDIEHCGHRVGLSTRPLGALLYAKPIHRTENTAIA